MNHIHKNSAALFSEEKHRAANKSTWVSVVVNIFLTLAQVIGGFFANSQSLIADGLHSLSDLLSDFVVLVASHKSKKDADEDHHYGHYRYETAASLILGVMLVIVGVGMLWNVGHKIVGGITVSQVQLYALWIAIGTLIAKELLFKYMLKIAHEVKSSMLAANAWHARSDAASSLVVVVGIIGSLVGYPILDLIAALVVGLIIVRIGWNFSVDSLHDLMDRSLSVEENAKIIEIVKSVPGVLGYHDLRTRKMGDMILVDVHLEINGSITVKEGHNIAAEVERRIMNSAAVLSVMTHIDPH